MPDQSATAPTRVIVLDLVSFVLLAAAAGLAFGIALAGMTLLFASHTAPAEASPAAPGGSVIERPAERPTGGPQRPSVPAQQPGRTMV
ncbi:MAG TPA: hypothetical protein VLA41_01730 [Burkholderiales bacterium]|nr:hypothetical protein [Burkholderiales bacterium]